MRRLLREPLLHFLLLGAAIFVAHRLVSGGTDAEPERIVVTRGDIESMVTGFSRTWQRSPTRGELDGLIRDRVREEVYYREALAMGLERDDTIIRRRLRQKLEFITDDVTAIVEPTDTELRAYLQAHPDVFRVEPQLTFSHVYLNPDLHGTRLDEDAARLLVLLQPHGRDAAPAFFGDPSLLERRLETAPAGEIAKQFGENFAASLGSILIGKWQGPVESAYGLHLVFVEARMEARVPDLEEVRDAVAREWANARRVEANEKFFRELLERYTVTVETPQPADDGKGSAGAR